MFNTVNSTLIYFQEIFVDQLLCPHITLYSCVDIEQCSHCLSEQRVQWRRPHCVLVEIEGANWLRAKSRADAARQIPIYTKCKIVAQKLVFSLC